MDFKSKTSSKVFDKCPVCGGKPFFQTIVTELKEEGMVDDNFSFFIDKLSGQVMQPDKLTAMLIGSEMPAYGFATDVCEDCGNIFCVLLERGVAKKTLNTQIVPKGEYPPQNRQHRRHP